MNSPQRLTARHGALLVVDIQEKLLARMKYGAIDRGQRRPAGQGGRFTRPAGVRDRTVSARPGADCPDPGRIAADATLEDVLQLLRCAGTDRGPARTRCPARHSGGDRGPRLRLQTALDLMGMGFTVQVVGRRGGLAKFDGLGVRPPSDGACRTVVTTTEAALFEWTETADAPQFQAISALVKDFVPPPEEQKNTRGSDRDDPAPPSKPRARCDPPAPHVLLGPRPQRRSPPRARRAGDARDRPPRPRVRRDHGRDAGPAPPGLPDREPAHPGRLRHRLGGHGGGRRQPDRAGRPDARLRQRRLRRPDGRRRRACRGRGHADRATLRRGLRPRRRSSDAVKQVGPKVVGIVHAETSTGAWQPVEEIAADRPRSRRPARRRHRHLLGGVPVEIDGWGIDAVYSGTQKCLSCPPGLAPVSFGPRAIEVIKNRKTKVQSWYLDMTMIEQVLGLRPGLPPHRADQHELRPARGPGPGRRGGPGGPLRPPPAEPPGPEGRARSLGLNYVTAEGHRLPQLNCVRIPEGVDDAAVRKRLLNEWNIEIGGGLGLAQGQGLADRPDGPLQPVRERHAGALGAGDLPAGQWREPQPRPGAGRRLGDVPGGRMTLAMSVADLNPGRCW